MSKGCLQSQQLRFLIDAIEDESPAHGHELFSDKLEAEATHNPQKNST